jgi:hypothetical protein
LHAVLIRILGGATRLVRLQLSPGSQSSLDDGLQMAEQCLGCSVLLRRHGRDETFVFPDESVSEKFQAPVKTF